MFCGAIRTHETALDPKMRVSFSISITRLHPVTVLVHSSVEAEVQRCLQLAKLQLTRFIYNLKVSITCLLRGFVLALWLVHTISDSVE